MGAKRSEPNDSPRLPHFAALDGLRAVALLVVLAFHGGFAEVRGGYLPLTAFFVLSGFLITALLLVEHHRSGRISLRAFWARRVRRLAPGALLGIGAAAAYVGAVAERSAADFTGDAVASASWWMNWRLIGSGRSYEATFAEPSPLQHLWSLSVEEQFYVVLPLLAAGALALGGGRRRWLVASATALVVASVVAMRALHHRGEPPLRAYFGTDARAAELLVGVLLATALVRGGTVVRLARRGRTAVDVAGGAALVVSVALWFRTREYDDRLYEGGLLGIALLAALVVAAATQPGTVVARVLGARPLAAYGRISYGVYLFHWPIFLWLDEARTGLATVPLFALRMAATTAAALLSFHLVEQPIRRGRLPTRVGAIAWANGSVAVLALAAVAAAAVPSPLTITLTDDGLAAPPPPASSTTTAATGAAAATPTTAVEVVAPPATTAPTVGAPPPAAAPTAPAVEGVTTTTGAPPPPQPLRIMVVGDSMAQNLGTGLTRWAERTGQAVVWDNSIKGCTLGRGGSRFNAAGVAYPIEARCGWWATEGAARVASFAPDVVLILAGFNDSYPRMLPGTDSIIRPGDPTYDRFLADEFTAAIGVLGSSGVPVAWTTAPCVDWASVPAWATPPGDGDAALARTRQIGREVAGRTGAPIVDLDAFLCPGGRYLDTVLGITGARPDGVHLADVTSELLAEQWLGPQLLAIAGR